MRLAIKNIPTPAKAVAHPAQVAAWENCAVMVGAIKFDAKKFPDFGVVTPVTMGRIPIEMRIDFDPTKVLFVDEKGSAVAVIEGLAVPVLMEA